MSISTSTQLSADNGRYKDSSFDKESAAQAGKETEVTTIFTYFPYAIFSYFEF
jgi:hypothetical protein